MKKSLKVPKNTVFNHLKIKGWLNIQGPDVMFTELIRSGWLDLDNAKISLKSTWYFKTSDDFYRRKVSFKFI